MKYIEKEDESQPTNQPNQSRWPGLSPYEFALTCVVCTVDGQGRKTKEITLVSECWLFIRGGMGYMLCSVLLLVVKHKEKDEEQHQE
jgi:hypothetical protein